MSGVTLLRKHHRETLWRGNQEMRRSLPELNAFRRRRVASPQVKTQFFLQPHSDDGRAQILPDIVSQRAQRRDVDALDGRAQIARIQFSQENIENSEKSRERLAAARGRRSRIDCRSEWLARRALRC